MHRWNDLSFLPQLGLAPDPGGVVAQADVEVLLVEAPETPVQHSPEWALNQGSPFPGPPATANIYVDHESVKW